jgi:DNA primase
MLQYDNDAIIEICSMIDLLEYASQSMVFEKRSESYYTHCPNHKDATPSLSITPSKNLFHCFSCKASGNILNWMMKFEGLTFTQALNKAASMANIDISKLKQSDALILFKKLKREQEMQVNEIHREIFNESMLDNYELDSPIEWIDEGIDPFIMYKYNIRIDNKANRILYPIYDNSFNLIGVKGRTRYKNYKELGLKKYQNYQKISTTDFFVGMKENIDNIKHKDEAIIFEGIKSGMKAEAWGYDNWISSETSCLNEEQVKILIGLKLKNIVIAYDNDVEIKNIKECCKLLKKFTNVYYISDKNKLLGSPEDKMSPVDKGEEIWNTLYKEKVKIR